MQTHVAPGPDSSCCVAGGLAAVIYTDTLQAFVMVGGAACLMVISEYYRTHPCMSRTQN